jgi:hypothetical protein
MILYGSETAAVSSLLSAVSMKPSPGLQIIEWTADGMAAFFDEDVSIDHCCSNILMAEQLLDGANIVALFEEACGKGMSERVATPMIWNSRTPDCPCHGALDHTLIEVVAA